MPNLELNGSEYHFAPKNAGTTVRMWLKHYEGQLPEFTHRTDYYTLHGIGLPSLWIDNSIREPRFFSPGKAGAIRWCIKRDPVDRFISAYTDKVLHEALVDWSVDICPSMLETGEMDRLARDKKVNWLAAIHFIQQSAWLGTSADAYDHVFDIGEMDRVKQFCEDVVFKIRLPALHARNQARSGVEKVQLTAYQRARVERIFSSDFAAGWR